MSTPIDLNVVMPYGVTVEGDGQSRKAMPVTKSSKVDSGNRLRLTSGPCRIAASWSGPEEVRVTIFGVGYPLTIPAGGVSFCDGVSRRESWRRNLPGERCRCSASEGHSRHSRSVPAQLRVAATTRAVV